jgi:hypothetical protein
MKTRLWVGAVALTLMTLPAQARAACWPCQMNCEPLFKFYFSCGPHVQLGPWYHYFPYEAHFQTPAPVGPFPNWQSPVAVAPAVPDLPAFPATPAPPPAPWQGPTPQPVVPPTGYLQPTGYYGQQQVPSYWYGQR